MKHQIITTDDSIRISPKIDGVEIFADLRGEQWVANVGEETSTHDTVEEAIQAVQEGIDYFATDDERLTEEYKKLGREYAETEEYTNSEDAWESEHRHYELRGADREVAAEAFGEGFISYTPEELVEVMTPGEAVEVYGLAEATVRQAINRGQIFARKSGGTWLIRRKDAEARWGKA